MNSVVIIDDHPAIIIAVQSVMESRGGFKVVGVAENGATGLSAVRELKPDLVILDLDLPQMSGIELLERLRATDPLTKVLAFSAQQESIYAVRALQAHANGFLSKAQELHKLHDAAQAVLSGYSMFPNSVLMTVTNSRGINANDRIKSLSGRELTVLQCLARGMSNKGIAETLLINNKTVSGYKMRIFEKLGVSSIVELVDFGRSNGLTV